MLLLVSHDGDAHATPGIATNTLLSSLLEQGFQVLEGEGGVT